MTAIDYEFWTTAGTVGAVLVALGIALTQATVTIVISIRRRRLGRRKVASLVSAWIEHKYDPSPNGAYYRRTVSLHLANESDEPVYRIEVICGIETEHGTIRLGPLAAPRVLPVLPPKREFEYDITMGMLGFGDFAQDFFRGLVAEVEFRDSEDKRWQRDFRGKLRRIRKTGKAVIDGASSELDFAQAGPVENPYNPLSIVFSLIHVANDQDVSDADFYELLAPHAEGWRHADSGTIRKLRELLQNANLPSHVWYPAPRVAYVRILDDRSNESAQWAEVLTLVWRNEVGWTLFAWGPGLPWNIGFTPGELNIDPLDGRE